MADAPLQELDDHQLAAVFAVKAQAASQLLQTLRNHDGRYLILYSSADATLGAPGQERPCAGLRLPGRAGPAVFHP
ncbi:KR domain-containing protein [Klebsiella pneumoniae]|nr:KR domain-containing protein [Klebsiella pneumoniae]